MSTFWRRSGLWSRPPEDIFMKTIRAAGSFVLVVAVATSGGWLCAQQMQSLKPMAADAHPSFDVASIKLADPDDHSSGFPSQGRRVFIENETMNDIISYAVFWLKKKIVGGPEWFGSKR